MLAVRGDGLVCGSVSKGCVEDDLDAKVRAGWIAAAKPQVTIYGVSKEDARRFGLPCGGKLQIVLEPVAEVAMIAGVLARIERHELVARALDLKTGAATLAAASRGTSLTFDGEDLVTAHGPRWRLLVIGAGQLSNYVAQMAQALDYEVIVCDLRIEYADMWDVPAPPLNRGMPDDVVMGLNLDSHSAASRSRQCGSRRWTRRQPRRSAVDAAFRSRERTLPCRSRGERVHGRPRHCHILVFASTTRINPTGARSASVFTTTGVRVTTHSFMPVAVRMLPAD